MTAFLVRDASLRTTKALPASNTTVYGDPIDLQLTPGRNRVMPEFELILDAPLLAVGELEDGATARYGLQHSVDAAFTSPILLDADTIVQTGAGGVGAAAVSKRYRVENECNRYVRPFVTTSANLNASAKSMTLSAAF